MQELANVISNEAKDFSNPKEHFQDALEKWAIFCLKNHRDGLLKRGLAISEAMSEYVAELEIK